jgi:hypothetical protein
VLQKSVMDRGPSSASVRQRGRSVAETSTASSLVPYVARRSRLECECPMSEREPAISASHPRCSEGEDRACGDLRLRFIPGCKRPRLDMARVGI